MKHLVDVIVSRHPAAVEFILQEAGLPTDTPALRSATDCDVAGCRVYGNLPLHLACLAGEYHAVEFDGDPPRGQEYTLDDMRAAGAKLVRYRVFTEAQYQAAGRAAAEGYGW